MDRDKVDELNRRYDGLKEKKVDTYENSYLYHKDIVECKEQFDSLIDEIEDEFVGNLKSIIQDTSSFNYGNKTEKLSELITKVNSECMKISDSIRNPIYLASKAAWEEYYGKYNNLEEKCLKNKDNIEFAFYKIFYYIDKKAGATNNPELEDKASLIKYYESQIRGFKHAVQNYLADYENNLTEMDIISSKAFVSPNGEI